VFIDRPQQVTKGGEVAESKERHAVLVARQQAKPQHALLNSVDLALEKSITCVRSAALS
jgi:hypothetical protein